MLISIKEKQSFDIAFVSNCKENALAYVSISTHAQSKTFSTAQVQ